MVEFFYPSNGDAFFLFSVKLNRTATSEKLDEEYTEGVDVAFLSELISS